MAEKSSEIIKFLFNMKVVATINHNIDKDTAEYIVKKFGHKPFRRKSLQSKRQSTKKISRGGQTRPPVVTIMGHVDHEHPYLML